MALQRGKLADIQFIGDSASSIYANSASTKTYIRGLVLHNTNTTTETVQIHNVPDSTGSVGAAGNDNRFLKVVLPPDETLFIDFEYPLVLIDTNDTLQAVTTTANKVTIQVLGDFDA